MENPVLRNRLREGAEALSVDLTEAAVESLLRLQSELLRWNAKVNLTAVTRPDEVLEKHLLDSLAVVPEVRGAASLLDVGTGAGFPGIPIKVALPEVQVTLVEAVGKKVGFLKHVLAALGVQGARAMQVRVDGVPEREGLAAYDRVISRAFTDVERWVPLAAQYLTPEGRVLSMVGKVPDGAVLDRAAQGGGLKVHSVRRYTLPFSKDPRAVVSFCR